MDQLYDSQLPCTLLGSWFMRFLLLQHAIYRYARFSKYNTTTCRCSLSWLYCIPPCGSCRCRSRHVVVAFGRYIRVTGSYLHPPKKMGNGWVFVDLHSSHSCLFFCLAASCVLEHGQILMVRQPFFRTNVRGSTRLAQGENGKTVIISDEGRFDPRSIPKRKWEEYQVEMMERNEIAKSEISSVDGRQSVRTSMFVPTIDQRGRFSRAVDQQTVPDIPRTPGPSPLSRQSHLGELPRIGGEVMEMQETSIFPSQRASRAPSAIGDHDRTRSFAGNIPGLPSDEQLLAEIRKMLESADLMTVTKKDVKQHLEGVFGVPLDIRKEYINQCTEAVLSGRL